MHKVLVSKIPKAVSDELTKIGARINLSLCVEYKGYWAVDFVMGQRYKISYSEKELRIERPVPVMQSGHQADWRTVIQKNGVSERNVISEAISLLLSVKE